jgi:hypothetical protein
MQESMGIGQKNPPASPPPGRIASKILLLLVATALATGGAELLLRMFWRNPLRFTVVGLDWPGYVRLQNGNLNARYDISGLYAGAGYARFRTEPDGALKRSPSPGATIAHVYGGSTTECRYVDEGKRWPELIPALAVRNYGVSGNNLLDGYFNFLYHLRSPDTRPRVAIFMDAVNDWSARNVFTPELYLANYERAWGADRRSNRPHEARGWYFADLAGLVRLNLRAQTKVMATYRAAAREQQAKRMPPLPEPEFAQVLAAMHRQFLPNRAELIGRIARLGREHGIRIVFVTQPNAYRADYQAWEDRDLRLYPDWENRVMTTEQTGRLMEAINQNSREAAAVHGVELIDVAAGFGAHPPGPLFYDSVHLTPAGCALFGRLVEAHFTRPVPPPG